MSEYSLDEIRKGLSQIVGKERATELVAAAVRNEGLDERPHYTRDELRAVCDDLKAEGGMIGVVVSSVAMRLLAG